jgi:hypothetical protein
MRAVIRRYKLKRPRLMFKGSFAQRVRFGLPAISQWHVSEFSFRFHGSLTAWRGRYTG